MKRHVNVDIQAKLIGAPKWKRVGKYLEVTHRFATSVKPPKAKKK